MPDDEITNHEADNDEEPLTEGVEASDGPAEETDEELAEEPAPKPSWTTLDQVALTAIVTLGGALRIARVASPGSIMFDETYYAKESCWYVLADAVTCGVDAEPTQVHPPLGKWLIALGIRIFGYDSLGWRISAVVAGTVTIALLYILARKLLRSTLGASVASGLLAIDLLHFTQSRVSMLDIFAPLFGVAAFLFIVYDRDRLLERAKAPPDEKHPFGLFDRPWRIWAGLAAAAAVACKWTGILYLGGIVILSIVWEYRARKQAGERSPAFRTFFEEAPTMMLWMFVVPVAFYMFTYLGRIHGEFFALPWSENSWFGAWWDHQTYMMGFHRGLDASHSYQSPGWSWILIKRPVSYWYCAGSQCSPAIAEGKVMEVFAAGSPLVWWGSIPAILYVVSRWLKERSLTTAEGVTLMGFFITYGPWLIPFIADREAIFIFYLLPTIPFMCLAYGLIAARLERSQTGRTLVGVFCAAALSLFVFYYPLVANVTIKQESWNRRIWIFNNCDKPPGVLVTTTITETKGDRTKVKTEETTSDASLPPRGWCWI